MIRRVVLVVVAFSLIALVGLAAVWVHGQATRPAMAQTSSEPASDYSSAQTITVVGQGTVRIEPDIAQISIGVDTSAETVAEAVQESANKMESLLAALSATGIADKDIQTMHYSINLDQYSDPYPRTESDPEKAKPLYRVSNMVNVTVRDLERVGEVLDAVVEAGANNIWGVSFALDNADSARAEARAKALDDARMRAEALAELSEIKLGPVMAISEVLGGSSFPVAMEVAERAVVSGAGPISPGEVEVSYQIQVVYFIER